MQWLLESGTFELFSNLVTENKVDANMHAAFTEYVTARSSGDGKKFNVSGTTASIPVIGMLVESFDFWAWIFGMDQTTYSDIIAGISEAESDPEMTEIELSINSPGGSVSGLFEVLSVIKNASKPVRASVRGLAASAAYAIAAQANSISLANQSNRVGSVGVVVSMAKDENYVTVTSSKAPNKAPDVNTKKGIKEVQKTLDGIHDLFVQSISEGRGVSVDFVNANYGKGSTVLASDAVEIGMADSIIDQSFKPTTKSTKKTGAGEKTIMNLSELKAQHPDLYAQVVKEGATKERDRVNAHLKMGKSSGAMDTAMKAIDEGAEMTSSYIADYMSASMNRDDVNARGDETKGDVTPTPPKTNADDDLGTKVAAKIEASLGIEPSAAS